jgi:hypothetical protein
VEDMSEKSASNNVHVEEAKSIETNLVYDGEVEPEIHLRTWIALAAMFLLNYVQVFALQGPPAVVRITSVRRWATTDFHSFHILAQVSTTRRLRHGFRIHCRSCKQSSVR